MGKGSPVLSAKKRNASNMNEADLEVLHNANPHIASVLKEGTKLEDSIDAAGRTA